MTHDLYPALDMGFVLTALAIIARMSHNFSTRALAKRFQQRIESGERVIASHNFIRIVSDDELDLGRTLRIEYDAHNSAKLADISRRHQDFLSFIQNHE